MNETLIMIDELNKEINFKLSNDQPHLFSKDGGDYLKVQADGQDIQIMFLGENIYCSKLEKELEDIPVEKQMSLNERKNFEQHLRLLINDKLNSIRNLEM